ncbi:MAG: hypothetical protein ACI31V_05505 [Bacilli bacterium]
MNEKMQLELARLLYDYSLNNKMINKTYIDKLMDIIINGKGLNDYVEKYEISEKNSNMTASYIYSSKKITIYCKKLYEDFLNEMQYTILLPEDERYLFMNSMMTQIILHELEHANQRRIIHNENNLEANILKLCEFDFHKYEKIKKGLTSKTTANLYMIEKMMEYMDNCEALYDYAPNERLAQIKSYQELIDALRLFKDNSRIIEFEEFYKLGNILNGYKDTSSPTIDYLNTQGRNEELKSFDWYSDDEDESIKLSQDRYTLRDRMKYGLPIDEKEHQYVKEIFRDMSFL